jgi:hypothetical protein
MQFCKFQSGPRSVSDGGILVPVYCLQRFLKIFLAFWEKETCAALTDDVEVLGSIAAEVVGGLDIPP